MKITDLISIFIIGVVNVACYGMADSELKIKVNGSTASVWITSTRWYENEVKPSVLGSRITVPFGSRVALAREYIRDRYAPDMYFKPDLVGGSIRFDVDMRDPCKCNGKEITPYVSEKPDYYGLFHSATLLEMPAIGSNGKPSPGPRGDYYCDSIKWAEHVVACPEINIMESNIWDLRLGLHSCSDPDSNGYFPSCDLDGCSKLINKQDFLQFGWGPEFKINTQNIFTLKIEFLSENDKLMAIRNTLSQGDTTVVMTLQESQCGPDMEKLEKSLRKGMALVISNWGNLDDSTKFKSGCPNDCMPEIYIGNIQYTIHESKNDQKI